MKTSFLATSVLAAVLSASSAAAIAANVSSNDIVDSGLRQGMQLAWGIAGTNSAQFVLTVPASASREQLGDFNGVEMAWGTTRIAAAPMEQSASAVKADIAASTSNFDPRALAWGINS